LSNFDLTRGTGQLVIGGESSKASKAAQAFNQALSLKSQTTTHRNIVPPQHFKMVCSDAADTESQFQMLQSYRFSHPEFDKVEIRKDSSRNSIYLWHNAERVRKVRNLNRPFAGEE